MFTLSSEDVSSSQHASKAFLNLAFLSLLLFNGQLGLMCPGFTFIACGFTFILRISKVTILKEISKCTSHEVKVIILIRLIMFFYCLKCNTLFPRLFFPSFLKVDFICHEVFYQVFYTKCG